MESRTRPGTVLALCAALLLPLSACGPTAEQLRERAASPSAPPPVRTAPPRTPDPAPPPPGPVPESAGAAPARVGVAGSQAGMPPDVQDACQWLLRRDPEPLPGPEAGTCVAAAITAGGGGVQALSTGTSWLPAGDYTVRFGTVPGFAMVLQSQEPGSAVPGSAVPGSAGPAGLEIEIRGDSRVLRQGGEDVPADPQGSPEQAYAAVLADAAELTVRPERVAAMLAAAETVEVEYGALLAGSGYTLISGSFSADGSGDPASSTVIPEGTFSLYLDDYYRPARIEIAGLNQGIPSRLTAVNTQWGTAPLS